jgi:hypothetical protein
LTAKFVVITARPVNIPPTGPNWMAAEIVGLLAHSVVGQVWFSAAQCPVATIWLDHMSSTTTTSSAITHAGLRPNPRRYAIAQAALQPISTPNSTQPNTGRRSSGLIAIWKPAA